MKGIIVAGGFGTRLYPITYAVNKHLLPVYDKPMVYYPLTTLLSMGIFDICLVTNEIDIPLFEKLLLDFNQGDIRIRCVPQSAGHGIGQAVVDAAPYFKNNKVCVILGDNFFYSHNFVDFLRQELSQIYGAKIFSIEVEDPSAFGVVVIDQDQRPIELIEKPKQLISHYAITGLYFYDEKVWDIVKNLHPSIRDELEIVDINRHYLSKDKLAVVPLNQNVVWYDMGTPETLFQTASFVRDLAIKEKIIIGDPRPYSSSRKNFP